MILTGPVIRVINGALEVVLVALGIELQYCLGLENYLTCPHHGLRRLKHISSGYKRLRFLAGSGAPCGGFGAAYPAYISPTINVFANTGAEVHSGLCTTATGASLVIMDVFALTIVGLVVNYGRCYYGQCCSLRGLPAGVKQFDLGEDTFVYWRTGFWNSTKVRCSSFLKENCRFCCGHGATMPPKPWARL
ncbi:hypothetical protein OE88DRAFT_1650416 [Heliocybe sulcata]|uniref:Uncharacterized protein n=1 Tax=Heliocybe sulcata TaxID=5364 RepID=A0A5C3NHY4_9AGAM|nr:hypothetical protein OE88DRAFT_1650416 [Heliocybe sulcata]